MSYTHALGRVAELFQKVQQLETENAALRKENRKAHDMACEDAVERYRLNGENAALREDKERLDWLERRTAFFQLFRKDGVVFVQLVGETGPHECTSTRAAIDAARAKEAQP